LTVLTDPPYGVNYAAQHALDVRRHGAIAAQQQVPSEHPHLARLGNRMRRRIRHVVRIGPSRVLIEQSGELHFAEPGQAKGEYRGTGYRNDAELKAWLAKRSSEAALEPELPIIVRAADNARAVRLVIA
jgi:hypothetical protein